MSDLVTQIDLHLNQIKQWEDQLPDGVTDVFEDKPKVVRDKHVIHVLAEIRNKTATQQHL